jgi:hypothetical protein
MKRVDIAATMALATNRKGGTIDFIWKPRQNESGAGTKSPQVYSPAAMPHFLVARTASSPGHPLLDYFDCGEIYANMLERSSDPLIFP